MIRSLLVALLLVIALRGSAGQPPPDTCAVCNDVIKVRPGEKAWVVSAKSDPLQEAMKAGAFASTAVWTNSDPNYTNHLPVGVYLNVCDKCHRIPEHCYICSLPINDKAKGFCTSDGRWICPRDVRTVVLDEDGARTLFDSARQTAVDIIGGFFALKHPNVNVHVTDVFDRKMGGNALHTMAISKTTDTGSDLVHYVSVYTARPTHEAFYSCVHEYTHLWISENRGKHVIEQYTEEAICELVAYKVAEARGDATQMKAILANTYTRGRIKDLVQYAADEDLNSVINWVRNGTERTLAEGVATAAAQRAKPPETPLDVQVAEAQLARSRSKPRIESLGLNGIIRTPKGTIILLNGGLILGKGESGMLKLNGEQSRIRCVDIMKDSAVVQWEKSTNTINLKVAHH
jgi:hypothetical protein